MAFHRVCDGEWTVFLGFSPHLVKVVAKVILKDQADWATGQEWAWAFSPLIQLELESGLRADGLDRVLDLTEDSRFGRDKHGTKQSEYD